LTSLRDLEKEWAAGEITDAHYAALKDGYTARAAAVLRAIEAESATRRPARRRRPPAARTAAARRATAGRAAGSGRPAGTRPRTSRPSAPRSRRSVLITLGVAAAIVVVAVVTVILSAGGREPGQPVTGGPPTSSSSTSSTDKVDQALQLESEGHAVDALMLYDEILTSEPNNVEALAYRGWLLKRAGLADEALESLDRAVAADPTFPDAHFFRGMVLYQDKDDPAAAIVEFDAFLANNPPADFVEGVKQVRAKAEAAAAAKASGTPPPADPAPADASSPTPGG
jgi:tetratricopeptide (TPR) repeat protein